MGRHIRTSGVILKSYRVAEYHKGLIVLSPDLGVFHTTAFGAYKGKSKLSGVSEPFTDAAFLLYHDPVKDRYKVSEIIPELAHERLKGVLERYYTALFWSELLVKSFAGGGDYNRLFRFVREGLQLLDGEGRHEWINIQFIWRYLELIGFRPDTGCCDECGRAMERNEAMFLQDGRLVCAGCRGEAGYMRLSPGARNYLNHTFTLPFSGTLGVDLPDSERTMLRKLLYVLVEEVVGARLNTLQKGWV